MTVSRASLCYVLNGGAAHRCCSTVAAGWCCHTGCRTKPPAPTSFRRAPSSSSSFFLPLHRLLPLLFLQSPLSRSPLHAVTPSRLPHIHRQTNTPPPAPAPLLLSRLVVSVKLGANKKKLLPRCAFKIIQVAKDGSKISQMTVHIWD